MNKYYYLKGDTRFGPSSIDELKKQITRETLVWMEGMADWEQAKNIPEISNVLPPPAPSYGTPPPPKKEVELLTVTYEPSRKNIRLNWWAIGGALVIVSIMMMRCYYQSTNNENTETPTNISEVDTIVVDDETLIEDHQKKLEEDRKKNIIANWPEYFEAKVSSIKYNDFGGMSDVFIAVMNKTEYPVDYVRCLVTYFKKNGDIYKTETVDCWSIPPGETVDVQAPGSHRGTDVSIDIVGVKSDAIGLMARIN